MLYYLRLILHSVKLSVNINIENEKRYIGGRSIEFE